MNDLLILLLGILIIILLVVLFRKEKYVYNAYLAEQKDMTDDESAKFMVYYKRMEKEIKQKV